MGKKDSVAKYVIVNCSKCGSGCKIKWQPNVEFVGYGDGAIKREYKEVFICECYRCDYKFMADLSGKEIKRIE